MMQIDFTKLAVRISISGTPVGTGILLNPATDSEWVYLVTAKHCLKGCETLDLLSIDFFQGSSKSFESIQLSDTFERIDAENQDLTCIAIPSYTIGVTIPVVHICLNINEGERCSFRGFPKVVKSEKLEPVESIIYPEKENLKLLHPGNFDSDTNSTSEENVKGYSGSGIFLRRQNNFVLVGIVTHYLAGNNSFDGVSFSSLPQLPHKQNLPIYDELSEVDIKKLPHRIIYKKPDSFISRLVYPTKYSEKDEREPEFLYKIFDFYKPKIILLRGEGGIGKSLELQNIAAYFSNTESVEFFPVLIRLRGYVSESIDVLLRQYFSEWENVPINRLLLILDGYDEVRSKEREIFLRHLSRFRDLRSNCNILISTRSNFAESFENNEIEGFTHYILNAFEVDDVRNYVSLVLGEKRAVEFLTAIEGHAITSLFIQIPFYLAYFVELYQNDDKDVPQNLKELLDRFVNYRILKDSTRNFESSRKYIYEFTAKKLGFTLNLLGISQIQLPDISRVFNAEEQEILHRLSIVEVEENVAFKHLSFQEYLAAKVLSIQRNFEKIQQCITFGPDHIRLKPKWQNTLRLLIELVEAADLKNDLLNFVASQEPELLLRIEYKQISQENRFELFKKVIGQSDRIYRNEAPYYSKDLAFFSGISENSEVVYYLMDVAKDESMPVSVRGEHLFYLQFATNFTLYNIQELKDLVATVVVTNDWRFQKIGIDVLNSLKFQDDRLTELLINEIPNREIYRLRDEIYEYLNNLTNKDEFVGFYIEGVKVYHDWSKTTEYFGGLGYHLINGICEITSPSAVSSILEYVSNNIDQIDNHKSVLRDRYQESFIAHLAKNTVIAFKENSDIYEKAFNLFCSLPSLSHRGYIREFSSFFWETNTQDKTFWFLLKKNDLNKRRAYLDQIGSIASKTVLEECYIGYMEANLQTKDIWDIVHALHWSKSPLAQEFREKLITINPEEFGYSLEPSWDEINKKRESLDLELLLNKGEFKAETRKVFEYYITEELTKSQITAYRRDWTEVESNLIVMLLNDFVRNSESVTWRQVLKWIANKENWEWYVIGELYGYGKEVKLTQKHIEFIVQWCEKQINKVDFKTAIKDTNNKSWTSRWLEMYVEKFWIRYNFPLPENIMLDMLKFDTQSLSMYKEGNELSLSEIIVQRINNTELIISQVLKNLKEGSIARHVLSSHIGLCRKLDIKEAKPYIFGAIESNKYEDYELNQFLDVYLELGGDLQEMTYIFESFDTQNNFHWNLLSRFIEETPLKFRVKRLLEQNKSLYYNQERIFEGITLLIKTGSIESVKSLVLWTKEHSVLPVDGRREFQDISNLPVTQVLPLVFELLEFVILQKVQSTGAFTTAFDPILKMLRETLVNDEESFEKGKLFLKEMIPQTQSDANLHYRLNRFYYDIEKEYYVRKDDREELEDILGLVNEYVK